MAQDKFDYQMQTDAAAAADRADQFQFEIDKYNAEGDKKAQMRLEARRRT